MPIFEVFSSYHLHPTLLLRGGRKRRGEKEIPILSSWFASLIPSIGGRMLELWNDGLKEK